MHKIVAMDGCQHVITICYSFDLRSTIGLACATPYKRVSEYVMQFFHAMEHVRIDI